MEATFDKPMADIAPEKIVASIAAALGGAVAALKIWKVYLPKFRQWRERRAAARRFLETGLARLDEIADRQAQIELTMSFAHSVGEMTLMLAGVAAWKSALDGSASFIAPALAELLDMDVADARGFGWLSAIHPEDRNIISAEYRLAVAERRIFSALYRYQWDDSGRIVYVQGVAYPALNPSTGQVQEYWGRAKEMSREDWERKKNNA